MSSIPTVSNDEASASRSPSHPPDVLGLVIVWAPREVGRLGQVCIVPPTAGELVFGRGAESGSPRLELARHRGGAVEPCPPIASPRVSRRQLLVRSEGAGLLVDNIGRCPLHHNGAAVESATVSPGDTLRVGTELLLLCVRRPAWIRPATPRPPAFAFGEADEHGLVGESPAIWELRRQLAFTGPRSEHVLITGESGTGKELAARALHALSARARRPFVARSAATLPESLVDSELFGHARNYPNAGMPERPGLVGEAASATLFLDEIAELPSASQTHLLRVLDAGEYQRLGDSTARRADVRLVAATNRPEALRPELAARFKIGLKMPDLNERREDVALLTVHLLRTMASTSPEIAARLYPEGHAAGDPRVAIDFIERLVRHSFVTHVRELERLLWRALSEGPEHILDAPAFAGASGSTAPPPAVPRTAPGDVSRTAITAALGDNDWSIERTWRALGLGSRHVLTRLIAKHGITRPPAAGHRPG